MKKGDLQVTKVIEVVAILVARTHAAMWRDT